MTAMLCSVDHDLAVLEHQQRADDAANAANPRVTLEDVRASVLEALESGSPAARVLCVNRRTDEPSEESIGEAMAVLWDETLEAHVHKLLALPQAKEAREYIAAQHVRFCEGVEAFGSVS